MNTKDLGKEFYFFRPFFPQVKPEPTTSFLGNNYALKYLYPSAHDPSTRWGTVQNAFWKSMAYVVPAGDAALDANTSQSVKDQIASLESALPKEGNWNVILHAYESLLQEIPKPEKYTNRDAYIKDKIQFRHKLTEKIQKLNKGDILLLPATLQERVNIFYLLSREEESFVLKIIGNDDWMAELSGVPAKKIKDKEKVLSKICYTHIPESFFSEVTVTALFCDPLLENFFSTENVKSMLACLTRLAPEDAWVAKSANHWSCLGLIIQELRGKGKDTASKILMKRLDFQAHLMTLFKFYKQVRFDLEKDSKADTTLRKLVKAIAKEAYMLGVKGYLTKEDLTEIDRELNFIEQNCKKATTQALLPLDKIGKLPAVTFPFSQTISMPVRVYGLPGRPQPRISASQQQSLLIKLPAISTSMLSVEETKALKSCEVSGILKILKSKTEEVKQLNRELSEALFIEFFQNLPVLYTDGWWMNLTISQVLEVHRNCADMLKRFVECRKSAFPYPTPTLVVIKVGLFISNLRLAYTRRAHGIEMREYPLMDLEDIFGSIVDVMGRGHSATGAFHERPFFVIDDKDSIIIEELKRNHHQYLSAKNTFFSDQEDKQSKAISEEMLQSITRFFNSVEFNKIFQPHQQSLWSKPFRHPMFIALLSRMSITGKGMDIVLKLHQENKLHNVEITFSEKPKIEGKGWNKTEEERNEMQKDFDRVESLKLPEAISDDPQRVVDCQIEAYLEWLKSTGIETPPAFKKIKSHPYKKEELVDLLYLLRKKYAHLEVIAFLKQHPHLLCDADIRNYLECILFDAKGSSFKETANDNAEFIEWLPEHLQAEINRYLTLAKQDPSFYDHLLFHLLLGRKMTYLVPLRFHDILNQVYDVDKLHEKILIDPTLYRYHFRAAFEFLMQKFHQPYLDSAGLIEVIRMYHRLQTLPREEQDVDPNEMADMNRLYAVYTQCMHGIQAETIADLLDTLCSDQGLSYPRWFWKGRFPQCSNNSYDIDLLNGKIVHCRSKSSLVTLPAPISQHPIFERAFTSIDRESMQIHAHKDGDIIIYLVSDKDGQQGRIEEDKEGYKFYRQVPRLGELQVFVFKEEEFAALQSLSDGILYVYPMKPQDQVGLCLDAKGKLQFEIHYTRYKGVAEIKTVFDFRTGYKSSAYQVHPLQAMTHVGLKKLEFFEHPKDILLFFSEGQLVKVEFKRYGLTFDVKDNRLMCRESKFSGYYIDLAATTDDKKGLSYALLLRNLDEEMPKKLLLPAASVIKSEEQDSEVRQSSLYQLWTLACSYLWSSGGSMDKSPDPLSQHMPKHTKDQQLRYHSVTIHPCTEELLIDVDKNHVATAMVLLKQALLSGHYHLALTTLKQLNVQLTDLSKTHMTRFLQFLQVQSHDEGCEASIKIRLILKLKNLIEDKTQYILIKEKLDGLLCRFAKIYLTHSKHLDQRLLLNLAQFSQMALVVKQNEVQYYQDHFSTFSHEEKFWLEKEQIPIDDLEQQVQAASSRPFSLTLSKEGKAILYEEGELKQHFKLLPLILPVVKLPDLDPATTSCEKIAVDKLKKEMADYQSQAQKEKEHYLSSSIGAIKIMVEERWKKLVGACAQKREEIDSLLHSSKQSLQHLALKGGMQALASFQELSLAFMQRDLQGLRNQGLLLPNIDIRRLEYLLRDYFEAEVAKLMLRNALIILNQLKDIAIPTKDHVSLLYQLLAAKRYYSTQTNPELLVYECFAQKVFRQLGAESTQLHLFKSMLDTPNGIFQAGTGSGKTSVLSVLWGLMLADGSNLVVFKLLPALLEQSKAIFQEQLDIPFGIKIYLLQFNLKISPVIREKRKGGITEHSLFKQIYHKLLITIFNKGCVLTDYKSFPLLQEKLIKLNREFIARRAEGLKIPEIEMEHRHYLRKILILLKLHDKCLMDEFDLPNRSCNRLQIPLGKTVELPDYLHEKSLELYELIMLDNRLKLSQDKQRDLFKFHGKAVLLDLAKQLQTQLGNNKSLKYNDALLRYLIGEDEDILSLCDDESNANKDILAFYKDQICTFLPLALSKASGLGYKRSADGLRTIPCPDGEPQENSRPGHPIEEINYIIQDYIQNGVSTAEFKNWVLDLQAVAQKDSSIPQKQYKQFFPDASLPIEPLSEEEITNKVKQLNQTWAHVKHFLLIKLKELDVSGEVISMTPHDCASMSKEVSGISATIGCADELPKQLKNTKGNTGIMGEMVYRLVERTKPYPEPGEFNPDKPYDILHGGSWCYHAIIDGAAFYRRIPSKEVAEKLLHQINVRKAGFYDDTQKLDYVGEMDAKLSEKAFYFSKTKSRGADVALRPDAVALLTVDSFKTLEDLVQNVGRMRLKGQQIRIVRSPYDPHITDTEALLIHCARNQGKAWSPGLYHSKLLEISHLVREQAFWEWMTIEDFEQSLSKFSQWQSLFIQKPAHDYTIAGSYFEANKHQRKLNTKPYNTLLAHKEEMLKQAKSLGLKVKELEDLDWTPEVIAQMPEWVAGAHDSSIGLEIEEEMELEHELETEMDLEMEKREEEELQFDQCGDVPFYPPWKGQQPEEYSVAMHFHPAFDSRIYFIENFLPIARKDSLYKRHPFDKAMPRIRMLHVVMSEHEKISKVLFGDILDDVYHRPYGFRSYLNREFEPKTKVCYDPAGTYDIRSRRWVSLQHLGTMEKVSLTEDFQKIQAQVKFLNGELEDYTDLEWKALKNWLQALDHPEEMRQYFAKTILKNKPRQAEAFKLSRLYALFDELRN